MRNSIFSLTVAILVILASTSNSFSATDPWYDVRDYASFSAAIDAIGSTRASLRIPNSQAITANKTVPANVELFFIEGGYLDISSGVTVTINSSIQAPVSKIFSGAGTVSFPQNSQVKGVYIEWFGAVGDNFTDDTTAINKALNAVASGFNIGGTVYASPGVFKVTSPIDIPSCVQFIGSGMRSTYIKNYGNGAAIRLNEGVERAVVRDLTIVLESISTQVGILLDGNNVAGKETRYNSISNIEIVGPSLAGQGGLKLASTAGSTMTVITFNYFHGFHIFDVDFPVVVGTAAEGNMFDFFQIERFGSGSRGTAVTVNGHANQFYGFWMGGRGTGVDPTTELIGFQASQGTKNMMFGNADIGLGYLFDLTGGYHTHYGTAMGDTKYSKNITPNKLGPVHSTSLYDVDVTGSTGADRDLWLAGISGYSNGFTIQYKNSPQSMVYGFDKGPVGIGIIPTAGGTSSLHLAGGISQTATPAKNLRGSLTISNSNTSGSVTFATLEPDAIYFITVTPTSVSGTPAAGSNRIKSISKTAAGFTVTLETAPGSGNSVTFDWHLIR